MLLTRFSLKYDVNPYYISRSRDPILFMVSCYIRHHKLGGKDLFCCIDIFSQKLQAVGNGQK